MATFDDIKFYLDGGIAVLPVYSVEDGACTCAKGADCWGRGAGRAGCAGCDETAEDATHVRFAPWVAQNSGAQESVSW